MRFPYTERKNDAGRSFWTPAVPVTILTPDNRNLGGEVLVESGADRTHIPRNVAERLGIDLAGLPELTMKWGNDWETPVLDAGDGYRAIVEGRIVPIRPVI